MIVLLGGEDMRFRYLFVIVLVFITIAMSGCFNKNNQENSDEQYTSSLIFDESDGGFATVIGVSSNETEVIIPNTYNDKMVIIGNEAFKNNIFLSKVTINCFSVGEKAFESCSNLKDVVIGKNVCWIGKQAFANTEKLESITYFAEDIRDIAGGTFLNSGKNGDGILLDIKNNVKSFPGWFFSACKDVKLKYVNFEENSSCSYIGPYAFYSCKQLTSFVISKKVSYIGAYCFAGCEELKTVSFEDRDNDWKIYEYKNTENYKYIVNSDTIKDETKIAKKLVTEYYCLDWRK